MNFHDYLYQLTQDLARLKKPRTIRAAFEPHLIVP